MQSFIIQFQKSPNINQTSLATPRTRKISGEKQPSVEEKHWEDIEMLELTEKDFKTIIIKSIQQAILSVFKPIRKHKSSVKK